MPCCTRERLDAVMFAPPAGVMLSPPNAGYPTVIVPFGFRAECASTALPRRVYAKPSPFGIRFTSTACSEPKLIGIAYAFEQATKRRVPPAQFP